MHTMANFKYKKHLTDLGWVPSWQSSKKVEKKWKSLELGIHLAPKFSGARGGTYIQEEDALPITHKGGASSAVRAQCNDLGVWPY